MESWSVPGTLKLVPFFTVHTSPTGAANKDGSEGLLWWPFVDDAQVLVLFPECESVGCPLSLFSLGSTRASRRSAVVPSEVLFQSPQRHCFTPMMWVESLNWDVWKRERLNLNHLDVCGCFWCDHVKLSHFLQITITAMYQPVHVGLLLAPLQESSTWGPSHPRIQHMFIPKLSSKGKSKSTPEPNGLRWNIHPGPLNQSPLRPGYRHLIGNLRMLRCCLCMYILYHAHANAHTHTCIYIYTLTYTYIYLYISCTHMHI